MIIFFMSMSCLFFVERFIFSIRQLLHYNIFNDIFFLFFVPISFCFAMKVCLVLNVNEIAVKFYFDLQAIQTKKIGTSIANRMKIRTKKQSIFQHQLKVECTRMSQLIE